MPGARDDFLEVACEPRFARRLDGFDRNELDHQTDCIFGLSADLTIAYWNVAWTRFARQNGGSRSLHARGLLGRSVVAGIAGTPRETYRRRYERALAEQQVLGYEYECSSAARFRLYRMILFPLRERGGLLVVNRCIETRPHGTRRVIDAPDEARFRGRDGVQQCGHCRRVLDPARRSWHWVPAWVAVPPRAANQAFCPACLVHFAPDFAR